MRVLIAFAMLAQSVTLPAQIGYSTDFEDPPFTGSAMGVSVTGQDGFVLPPGSVACRIYTYAGNAPGVPANGNGGAQFFAGRSTATDARADHALTLPTNCRAYVQFDVCLDYVGTGAPQAGTTAGSFALRRQPQQNPQNEVRGGLIARWSASNPPAWDADIFVGPSTFTATQVPDAAFQGLPPDVWHQWGYTVDFSLGEYTEIRITNGLTNQTTVYKPPAGSMPVPLAPMLGTLQPVNSFRLHANDGDNLVALDNLVITYGATYEAFGSGGCAGTQGPPTLRPVVESLPRINTTFQVEIGNLPSNFAIMATGLSNTLALGSVPLPLDLGAFGFPGCNLLVSPDSTEVLVGTGNTATWSVVIPNMTSLLGTRFYNQGIGVEGPGQLAVTDGGAACIGY